MNLRKTLILGVLLAAVLAYIVNVQNPADEQKRAHEFLFPNATEQAFTKIEIRGPHGEVSLTQATPSPVPSATASPVVAAAPTEWHLSSLPDAALDLGAVNTLMTALKEVKLGKPVKVGSEDLSVYGLNPAILSLTVTRQGGSQEVKLGKENEYLAKRYLQTDGNKEVYLIAPTLFTAADHAKNDFRSKTPVSFSDSDVKTITISDHSGERTLERDEAFEWKIVAPSAHSASSEQVANLTRSLRNLQVKEFFDSPAANGLTKDELLTNPEVKVTVTFKAEPTREPLVIGFAHRLSKGEANGGDAVSSLFFAVKGQPSFYQANADALNAIAPSIETLREHQLLRFPSSAVSKALITRSDSPPLQIEKVKEAWIVNGKPADRAFVEGLFNDLSELKASGFPEKSQDFGFTTPRYKAEITLSGEKTTSHTLVVGAKAVDAQGSASYYAAADDAKEPFLITEADLKRISPHEEALLKVADDNRPAESPGISGGETPSNGSNRDTK